MADEQITTSPETAGTIGGVPVPPAEPPRTLTPAHLPAEVERVYAARGQAPTGTTYATHIRKFHQWLIETGQVFESMPEGTVDRFLATIANPITRNVAATAIRVETELAASSGIKFIPQTITRTRIERRPKAVAPVGAPGGQPAAAAAGPAAAPGPTPLGQPYTPTLPDPPAQPAQPTAMTPAAMTPVASPAPQSIATAPPLVQARPSSGKKPGSAIPSLGGRVRISKRVDGYEGTGASIGTRILIGDYTADDLDGESSIAGFIISFIRPKFGPHSGQPATTYYVERLDAQGNGIPGSMLSVPVMPQDGIQPNSAGGFPGTGGQGQMSTGGPGQSAQPVIAPQQLPSSGDRFLDFALRRAEEMEKRYEDMRAKLDEKVQHGQMDTTTMMLLLDREKPKLDPRSLREEFMRLEASDRPAGTPLGGTVLSQPHQPGTPGGLDGLFGPPPSTSSDKVVEALLAQVASLTAKVTEIATRPPPTPPPSADPMAMMTTVMGTMFTAMSKFAEMARPPPQQSNPAIDALITASLGRLNEKPKTMAEVIGEMRAMREAQELIGGSAPDKPGVGEVLIELLQNAEGVGNAIGNVLAKIPRMPQLPGKTGQQPGQKALPGGVPASAQTVPAQPVKSTTPPLPDAVKLAFRTMAATPAEDEQTIGNQLFVILQACGSAPDPWPLVQKRTVEAFLKADSKPEIRALVTQLFVWCGAMKAYGKEEIIEKVVSMVHKNYSFLFNTLTGGQDKTLADAPAAPAASAGEGESPADPAAGSGEPADEGTDGDAETDSEAGDGSDGTDAEEEDDAAITSEQKSAVFQP